jgi:hypothetical protein
LVLDDSFELNALTLPVEPSRSATLCENRLPVGRVSKASDRKEVDKGSSTTGSLVFSEVFMAERSPIILLARSRKLSLISDSAA